MSKSSTFTCDVCGSTSPTDAEMDHKPAGKGWLQFCLSPFHTDNVHHVPHAIREVCSTKCGEQLLMAAAARLAELRGGAS